MKDKLLDAAVLVAAGCALIVTVTLFIGRGTDVGVGTGRPAAPKPQQLKDWESLVAGGRRMGPSDALVTILEFGDFECPACKGFALQTVRPLKEKYPDEVAIVYRHWPLPYHKFAVLSALSAECAAEQGRFEQMHYRLYEVQDSIGLKPMSDIAKEAGVPDDARFASCVDSERYRTRVEADGSLPLTFGGVGTPTIAINGMLYASVPTRADIEDLLIEARKKADSD